MAIKSYLICNLLFSFYSLLIGNSDLKSGVAFRFLALIYLVDLCCGSTFPGNFLSLCSKTLLTVMSYIYFWKGLDRSGTVMTEDVRCQPFPWKSDFVIFIFENKSVISDAGILHMYFASMCVIVRNQWFNLNWQFWLRASCEAEIEQPHLIIGAGTTAQSRRDARFSV